MPALKSNTTWGEYDVYYVAPVFKKWCQLMLKIHSTLYMESSATVPTVGSGDALSNTSPGCTTP
jgi:hypothetical protein